jgi:predicted NBD/HSP70 family sugar kinase
MKTTGDQQLVKRINRSVLLRLLRVQPGLSRAQLAAHSGLTKSTVSLLVRELIAEDWLTEVASTPTAVVPSQAGQGRPSTPLHINVESRGLIGVEIAVDCLRVAAVSLLGEVLWSAQVPLASNLPSEVCAQAAQQVALAQAGFAARGMRLLGVGLGLPGAFDDATGVVRFAPNLGWRNVDFLPLITRALSKVGLPEMPVHVQNEADTAALSEYEFAEDETEDALIFVTCDVGVGAGIVLNDRLFTGMQGMAGEIGHSILQIDGPQCSCGRRGCAETFIGARALAREARQFGGLSGAGRSAAASGASGAAGAVLGKAGHYLGVLMQNLWTTFDPGTLVVGGPSCSRYPELVQMAQATLQAYAASAGMVAPAVRPARYGLLASAVGAAALVLHQVLRPMHPRMTRASYAARQRAAMVPGGPVGITGGMEGGVTCSGSGTGPTGASVDASSNVSPQFASA